MILIIKSQTHAVAFLIVAVNNIKPRLSRTSHVEIPKRELSMCASDEIRTRDAYALSKMLHVPILIRAANCGIARSPQTNLAPYYTRAGLAECGPSHQRSPIV
jgi:hypothetical protein